MNFHGLTAEMILDMTTLSEESRPRAVLVLRFKDGLECKVAYARSSLGTVQTFIHPAPEQLD